jgi:hypothetical protein
MKTISIVEASTRRVLKRKRFAANAPMEEWLHWFGQHYAEVLNQPGYWCGGNVRFVFDFRKQLVVRRIRRKKVKPSKRRQNR